MSMVTEVKRSRAETHDAMLREALSQPGVREVMKVYENWRVADESLAHYRRALKRRRQMETSNHTSAL